MAITLLMMLPAGLALADTETLSCAEGDTCGSDPALRSSDSTDEPREWQLLPVQFYNIHHLSTGVDGRVDVVAHSGVYSVASNGSYEQVPGVPGGLVGIERGAEGALYGADGAAVVRYEGGASARYAPGASGVIGFGPDGLLYFLGGGKLVATNASAQIVRSVPTDARDAAFAPDGRLYQAGPGSTIYEIDLQTGARTTVMALPTYGYNLVFDANGRGYVWTEGGGVLEIDLSSQESRPIVRPATNDWRAYRLGMAGTHLYLGVWASWYYGQPSLYTVDIGVAAFEGWRVARAPPPLPDLVVSRIAEDRAWLHAGEHALPDDTNHSRQIHVRVTNAGTASAAPGFSVRVERGCVDIASLCATFGNTSIAEAVVGRALAPGESEDLSFNWNTLGRLGPQVLRATADPRGPPLSWNALVFEADENNNVAAFRTYVWTDTGPSA